MNYGEALEKGYTNGDWKWERGYVSRNCDKYEQQVWTAGGTRYGEKYVLLPSWRSTQYCIRQYLIKPKTQEEQQ